MAMQWIEANGARFRYDHHRREAGTVVLLHEMGGTLEGFDEVAARLGERWSILRYDQRGAGLSDRISAPLGIDTPADDLAALLDALSIKGRVAIVGAAVGAAVAIRFASRWPSRVGALALLAPSTGLIPGRYAAAMSKIESLEIAALSGDDEERASTRDPASYAATWRMLIGLDLEDDLARLSCPVLVAAGSRDNDRPPAHVADIASKVPGAKLVVLETGHVMAIETPELVAATIAGFLGDVRFG